MPSDPWLVDRMEVPISALAGQKWFLRDERHLLILRVAKGDGERAAGGRESKTPKISVYSDRECWRNTWRVLGPRFIHARDATDEFGPFGMDGLMGESCPSRSGIADFRRRDVDILEGGNLHSMRNVSAGGQQQYVVVVVCHPLPVRGTLRQMITVLSGTDAPHQHCLKNNNAMLPLSRHPKAKSSYRYGPMQCAIQAVQPAKK